ncbi:MAG: hypothetical protein AAGC95_02380 [Pseudomonadota bacterium]
MSFVNEINLAYGNGGYDDHLVSISERPHEEGLDLTPSTTIHEMIMAMNMGILAHAVYNVSVPGTVIWRRPKDED